MSMKDPEYAGFGEAIVGKHANNSKIHKPRQSAQRERQVATFPDRELISANCEPVIEGSDTRGGPSRALGSLPLRPRLDLAR